MGFTTSHSLQEMAEQINFTTINHIARVRMGLSLVEYCLADLIYNLANSPKSSVPGWCYASKPQLARNLDITERQVYNLINTLVEKGLVEKDPETSYLKITINWYEAVIIKRGGEELPTHEKISGVLKKDQGTPENISVEPMKEVQGTYITNKDINIKTLGVASKDENQEKVINNVDNSVDNLKKKQSYSIRKAKEIFNPHTIEEIPKVHSMKSLGEALKEKGIIKEKDSTPGIYKDWQEKAFRYAETLGIKLEGADTGRWLKIFKQANEGRKAANIEDAYSYLIDHPTFHTKTNDKKLQNFFYIYENGRKPHVELDQLPLYQQQ